MTLSQVIDALAIPEGARVNRRVPKKLLLQHGAPTAADKRLIQDSIEEALWVAALKPVNIGVPEYRDETREYLEIAVLSVTLRVDAAKLSRLTELIHRAIPYPVALATTQKDAVLFSLAHKRASQGEAGKVVIEEVVSTKPFRSGSPCVAEVAFLKSLSVALQPSQSLFALYQGWISRVEALAAASITGSFAPAESPEQAATRRAALEECARLEREITGLRASAAKEKQMNRKVELNLEIHRREERLARSKAIL